jgi:hypothetical protein
MTKQRNKTNRAKDKSPSIPDVAAFFPMRSDTTGSTTSRCGPRPIQPPCLKQPGRPIQPHIITTWLDGTNDGSPLGGPTEVGAPLGDLTELTEENRLDGTNYIVTLLRGPTEENRLDITNEGSPLEGPTVVGLPLGAPTTIGPPLGGPKDENRPLLGAVALLSTQLGMTGSMEPIKENRLDGTHEGPPLRGPTKVGPPLGDLTDMTGSPTPTPRCRHPLIQPPCTIQPRISSHCVMVHSLMVPFCDESGWSVCSLMMAVY